MIRLWRERVNYLRYDSWSDDDLQDVSVFLGRFLPYARHYNDLGGEELEVLIQDARQYRWQVIDLGNCGLNALPDSIGSLEDMRVLDLSNAGADISSIKGRENTFTSIPESLCRLSSIQRLNLHNTPITSLPESVGNLTSLKSLDLSNTNISTLPDSIGNLHNLKSLYLNNCHLKDIPYSVVQLGLPFVMNDASAHNCVNLYGVTLKDGDLSLFTRPREFIEQYYRNRVSDEDTVQECKVIFLGDGAAGKSSLIERIIHDKFEENGLPTDGVRMIKWTRWPNGKPLELDGKPLILLFLDFGGQEIMHSMHRCFLTSHTVYVVVCEGRDDAEIDSVAARWMETVRSFAPGCPVILALNKSDLNQHVTINERTLKSINSAYRVMFHTSAKIDGDPGVRQLVEYILKEVPDCIRKMNGNKSFLDLKNELEGMEEDYIFPDQFQKRCEELDINQTARDGLLSWFQDLGVAYTYTTTIREVYVLKPAWLTNGIYRLILRTGNGGFLRHSTIRETLGNKYSGDVDPYKTYKPHEMAFILHIMRKFEISMCVTPDYVEDGVEMIPMKMHKTPPPRYDEFQKTGALHLRWEAVYLPNNLVHRLIIRKYSELDPERKYDEKCVWRTGGWFRSPDGECDALVDMTDRAMDVYVRGKHDARVYMDSFRQEILLILDKMNITAKEYVCCTINGREGKVSYQAVQSHCRMEKSEMYVEDLDVFVSPGKLLQQNYKTEMRDFFISYNNSRDAACAKWIADTLRASGVTVHFQGDDCKPGMDFLRWMEDAIPYSRNFLAVWSGAYHKSDYCKRELNAAIARQHRESDYIILPVRVEDVPVENVLIQPVVRVDLLTGNEDADRAALLDAVRKLKRMQ